MPVIVVKTPDGRERVVELGDKGVVLGRAEEADVVLADPKVSSRHLRLRPVDGGWVIRDLDSTQGTRRAGKRILRAAVKEGDVFEIGASWVTFLPAAPAADAPSAPVVSGSLELKPVDDAAPAPAPAPAPAAPPPPTTSATPAGPPPPPPAAELDTRKVGRAVLLLVVGLLVAGAVHVFLGGAADQASETAAERQDLQKLVQNMDISTQASATFEEEVNAFLAQHPTTDHRQALLDYLAVIRAKEAERFQLETHVNTMMQGLSGLDESEVRGRLIELSRGLPDDEDIALQVQMALQGLDRQHALREQEALEAVLRAGRRRVADGDPAGALRRLTAFRVAWPALTPEAIRDLRQVEDEAIRAARSLEASTLERIEKLDDAGERRRLLARAYLGLAGTPQGDRLADELRFVRLPRTPAVAETPEATPTGPTPPSDTQTRLLARAAVADDLAHQRKWSEALAAYEELFAATEEVLLQDEWSTRIDELKLLIGLVDRLDQDAHGERALRRKMGKTKVRIKAARPAGLTIEAVGADRTIPWIEIPNADLLGLLTPAKPGAQERLGMAVLAASLSRRDAIVEALLPLFEKGESLEEANALAARYIHGRNEAPTGGYRAYKGEILDQAGFERKVRNERIAVLRQNAGKIFEKLAKESAWKKLAKLDSMRSLLDERRRYAVLAIFNETHYPYPANKSSRQYQAVQNEIDRRIEQVREIWDDPYKVVIDRKGRVGKILEEWDEILAELHRFEHETADLEARMAKFAPYANGEPVTIRNYFRDETERKRQAYNRWVMDTYNPAQTETATDSEGNQTAVTNAYRLMMGYQVRVKPGPANVDAIDDTTVAKILDEAKVVGEAIPLLAVRIDDRLVMSSRLHSQDMQARGFFAHQAPPNATTGDPGTSPFQRMKKAGYGGMGASENIAQGASNAEQAHQMWIHSSGHHRNILSKWHDQGVGRSGRYWTQNFGLLGGAPVEIPAAGDGTTTPGPQDRSGPEREGGR